MTGTSLKYFFDLFSQKLFYFALGIVRQKQTAEDIVADAFVKAYDQDCEDEKKVKSFLFLVVANASKNELKRVKRLKKRDSELMYVSEKTFEFNMDAAEKQKQLSDAIESLPELQKRVIKLYIQDTAIHEIAKQVNKRPVNVSNIKADAIKNLKLKIV